MVRRDPAVRPALEFGPAERIREEAEFARTSVGTCASLFHFHRLKLDFCCLPRRQRNFASLRKVLAHNFRIPVFELLGMVNGKKSVFAGREKWQVKGTCGIGRLNDRRGRRVAGKGENRGAERMIVEQNVSTERSSVI